MKPCFQACQGRTYYSGGISSSVAGADCFAGSWTANVDAWVDGPNMVWCDEIRHQVQARGDGRRDGLAA
jgi:hypothetical protein